MEQKKKKSSRHNGLKTTFMLRSTVPNTAVDATIITDVGDDCVTSADCLSLCRCRPHADKNKKDYCCFSQSLWISSPRHRHVNAK
jgi:hypothetical protein